ncbi:Aste57867_2034 [Aphanomyces stellatus]|uniref:Aste57867_2034 protein n=1 Tax=Aphanomyces stellatus TaxID=120398 RepID=A0A485K775_9STRA|nr:hypothetical protein As57867_002030 [Aphanomyces stellatus]VFT79238.1 Aste57867_2034 [Aphanomyces stellatus]
MTTTSEATPLVQDQQATTTSTASTPWLVRVGAAAAVVVGGIVLYTAFRTTPTTAPATATAASLTFCDATVKHEFGYIQLPHKVDDHYFYSFFESRNDPTTDPLVIWLEGGPGSSSTWALLNANGPCTINAELNGTTPNPYSWTTNANVIWLDQPTGVGFSYGDATDDDSNEIDVGRNVYGFLQGWLKQHPQFQSNPFFITGQSYGGHYVPAAANYIVHEQAKAVLAPDAIRINLQGIAIGNGNTDTVVQFPLMVNMAEANAYNITLVTPAELAKLKQDAARMKSLLIQCQAPNETQACVDAVNMIGDLLTPMVQNPTRDAYDIRNTCDPPACIYPDMANTETFLNRPDVQATLGVHKAYQWNNQTVAEAFTVDIVKSTVGFVPNVLAAGVRVLIYAGDADLVCNWIGNDAWTKQLEWPHKEAYNAATVMPLTVDGRVAGDVRSSNGLSFVRVYDSGHGVTVDQPAVGLALINRFVRNASLGY